MKLLLRGGLFDGQTGLVRFGARDYDPETGRFTAKDPTLFGGDNTNLYAYALGDPVNLRDPGGRRVILNHIFNNPLVLENLQLLNAKIMEIFCLENDDFTIVTTGGDRYIDADGNHRSATDGRIVPGSGCNEAGICGSSPHLIEAGARGVDFGIFGITREQLERAARGNPFIVSPTRYRNGHIHMHLPWGDAYTGEDPIKHAPAN